MMLDKCNNLHYMLTKKSQEKESDPEPLMGFVPQSHVASSQMDCY